jgi:hypothetical protein
MVGGGADVADGGETTIRWGRSTDTCSTFAKADVGSCGVIFLFLFFFVFTFYKWLFLSSPFFSFLDWSFVVVVCQRDSRPDIYATLLQDYRPTLSTQNGDSFWPK